jgi:hypothetical protein
MRGLVWLLSASATWNWSAGLGMLQTEAREMGGWQPGGPSSADS